MKLEEVLSDEQYRLISDKLCGRMFIEDDGKLIPKYRFDEVSGRMHEAEAEAERLSYLLTQREEEIGALCEQICEIKNGYNKALNILRVKEIFVSGGLTQSDYQDLVEIIVKTGQDDMLALAGSIIKLINEKSKVKS